MYIEEKDKEKVIVCNRGLERRTVDNMDENNNTGMAAYVVTWSSSHVM
jgi:hypothetical protein